MIVRTFDIIRFQAERYPGPRAMVSRVGGKWEAFSTQRCIEIIDNYSLLLLQLGVKPTDKVVIVPSLANANWVLLDLAIQQIGAVVTPVPDTTSLEHFRHILDQTECKLCFLANRTWKDRFSAAIASIPPLRVVLTEGGEDADDLAYLLTHTSLPDVSTLNPIREAVAEADLAAIIYTSGTTGMPKGVMLTHHNIVSNLRAVMTILPLDRSKISLSLLPFCHVMERMAIYSYLATGVSLHMVGDRDYLERAFVEVKPHFFTVVPRILEKMYEEVWSIREKQGWLGKRFLSWALTFGQQYKERPGLDLWYRLQLIAARLLVFRRFKARLGGRVEAVIVGAAWLRPQLGRLLSAIGIKVREGYGMTETAPIISMNHFNPGLYSFGTVGLPLPGVEVRIDQPDEAGEGEILVKGPNVMAGYFKQEEETSYVLDANGWFHTGDIGKFVKKRFLQITDRKKDIFKTSSGKYIAPQALENHFRQSPFIEQVIIIGFQKPFVTALIKPNYDLLESWCKANGIHWTSPQYMALNIKVKQKIEVEIKALNATLPNYQTIRAFHLLHEELTIASGMLTYTYKLVRSRILEKYAKEIEVMYKGA